jgi:hypothetical protein
MVRQGRNRQAVQAGSVQLGDSGLDTYPVNFLARLRRTPITVGILVLRRGGHPVAPEAAVAVKVDGRRALVGRGRQVPRGPRRPEARARGRAGHQRRTVAAGGSVFRRGVGRGVGSGVGRGVAARRSV